MLRCAQHTSVMLGVASWVANDVIIRMGVASAVGARLANDVIMRWCHNDNSWLTEIWRLATCGTCCNALVIMTDCFVLCSLVTSSLCDEMHVWRVDRVTSSLVSPGAAVLACHRPRLKSSLLKMEATFGQFSERILRHSKTCNVWWHLTSKKKALIYDRVWQPVNNCRYLATGTSWRHVL